MNYIKVRILIISLILCFTFLNVFAHPGNTDSNGGHTCYTNCSKWGYSFGEYHFHSSKTTSNTGLGFSQSYNDSSNESYEIFWLLGGVILFIAYKILKVNDSDTTRPKTTRIPQDNNNELPGRTIDSINISTRTTPKSNNASTSSVPKKVVHYTNDNISLFFINKDLRDLTKYLQSLEKTYSDFSWFITDKGPITFVRLSGTTFENRQEHIRTLYEGKAVELFRMQDYGSIECFVNLNSIGVIPSIRSNEIRKIFTTNLIKECYVESIRGGIGGKNYGVVIAIVLKDNIILKSI